MDLTPFHGPPAAPPEVPGFRLHLLLGSGAHGEVWRAEDLISGEEVALKIGRRVDAGNAEPSRHLAVGLDYETALLSRIEHPHVVRFRRVVALPDERLALVLDLAAGGSLAALVAGRGGLTVEEVVTLLVPLVSALEHLHQSGLTHGDVSPGNILFAADGCPQLSDLGVARVLGERNEEVWSTPGFTDPALLAVVNDGGPVPADRLRAADLWSLAACGWFALTARAPEERLTGPAVEDGRAGPEQPDEMRRLLARILSSDPASRPGAAEFADLIWQAARPAPIRLDHEPAETATDPLETATTRRVVAPVSLDAMLNVPGVEPAPTARRDARSRRSLRRTVPVSRLLAFVLAVGLVGAGTAAVGWRLMRAPAERLSSSESTGVPRASSKEPVSASRPGVNTSTPVPGAKATLKAELTRALSRIGKERAQAFEMVSQGRLERADEPGSPAEKADRDLLERLRKTGYRLEDLGYRIGRVTVLRVQGRTAEVTAVVSATAHRQVRVGGGYAAGVPKTKPAVMVFTLHAVGPAKEGADRWLVHDLRSRS